MNPGSLYFCNPTGRNPRYPTLLVRGSIIDDNDERLKSVVSGKLRVFRRSNVGSIYPQIYGSNAGYSAELEAHLILNPTRAVRYQRFSRQQLFSDPDLWQLGDFRLYGTPWPATFDEICLDGNDNVLISHAQQAISTPDAWPIHLERYLEAVLRGIGTAVDLAATFADAEVHSNFAVVVRKCETYWEFSHRDALGLVQSLAPTLVGASISSTTTHYPLSSDIVSRFAPRTHTLGNSISTEISISAGVSMRAYAKTQHRVRIELEHNADYLSRQGRRRTASDINELVGVLENLAEDAARRMNELARIITNEPPAHSHSTADLFSVVSRASQSDTVAFNLLLFLIYNGRIATPDAPEYRKAVASLQRSGVLVRAGRRSKAVVLAPTWRVPYQPSQRTLKVRRIK